jgi:putative transport protein
VDALQLFLEQQPLLTVFVVVALGYAVGGIDIRGFSLGIGAVLFVGLALGMFAPGSAPPALVGSLGLVMFVYGIGIQYGRQFFTGLTSPFGLKVNGLSLLSNLTAAGTAVAASALLPIAPAHLAGLFCGALTSTPALQAAIARAGGNEPALGYSVAYPIGLVVPILCLFVAGRRITLGLPAAAGTGLELREIVVRSPTVIGRTLGEVSAELPPGVQVVIVREGHHTKVPAPDIVLDHDDVVAVAGESETALEQARALIGEAAPGRITKDRLTLDYFRFVVSRHAVVGMRVADLAIPGASGFSVVNVRRGDADLLPRPDLILEFGDRVGVAAPRRDRDIVRAYFGDSIKGMTEFSYVALGVGMALGVLLGLLPVPVPGVGAIALGVAGGPLIVALVLGRLGRTGGWVWTMPVSANLTLRNFGLTLFLAQVGLTSGPKFLSTVQQFGALFLTVGAVIVLVPAVVSLLVGHFVLRLGLDDLLGATAGGVSGNPSVVAFASRITGSDRVDIAYATTYPGAVVLKIVLVQVILALMGTV